MAVQFSDGQLLLSAMLVMRNHDFVRRFTWLRGEIGGDCFDIKKLREERGLEIVLFLLLGPIGETSKVA